MKKRNFFKASLYIILAVSFLVTAQIYYFISKGTFKSKEDKVELFQNIFHVKENIVTEELLKLQSLDIQTIAELDSFISHSRLDKAEYILIVYKNNDLFYWSDNPISIPDKYYDDFFKEEVTTKVPYLFYKKELIKGQFRYIGLIKIQKIEQGDKAPKKVFCKGFDDMGNSTIELTKQKNNIYDNDGHFVLSVNYNHVNDITVLQSIVIITLYIFLFSFIVVFILIFISYFPKIRKNANLIFLGMTLFILFVRYICYTFEVPYAIFDSKLFSSENRVVGILHPQSIGKMFLDTYFLVIIAAIFFKYFGFKLNRIITNKKILFCALFLGVCIVSAMFYSIIDIISHLMVDTNYLIDPNKLVYFNEYSVIVILIIFGLFFAFSLVANRLFKMLYVFLNKNFRKIIILMCMSFVTSILFNILYIPSIQLLSSWIVLLFLYIYFTFIVLAMYRNKGFFDFFTFFFNVIFFAAFLSIITSTYLEEREIDFRSQLGSMLASNQENTEENNLQKVLSSIYFSSYATNQVSKIDSIAKQLNRSIIEEYSDITSQYSFAYFVDDKLIDQYGSYYYSLDLNYYKDPDSRPVNIRNYEHYISPVPGTDNEMIVISKKEDATFSKTSAFSFFAIVFFIYFGLLSLLIARFSRIKYRKISLRSRIQWSFFVAILIVGLFICSLSVRFFTKNYYNTNNSYISKKMQSIQFLFTEEDEVLREDTTKSYLVDKLTELSHIYSADIMLFNDVGQVIATSSPELINHGYTGNVMDRTAMIEIIEKKRTLLIQEEYIGSQKIMSAYKPIFNQKDEIIEVINLLFIGNKDDFKLETSSFISHFLSFYFFLILFSILFSWLIYMYISKPLGLIKKNLSGKNEKIKIQWEHNDEIGRLIQEHNRMVEELRGNAELLAKSERETAWREMAKQVAHEIKNPLTPMKLNIQMLQKSWSDKKDDFEVRFNKVSTNLLQQIDTLSEIASTFSEFAITQNAVNTKENIIVLLHELQESLQDEHEIRFGFHYNTDEECNAMLEKNQFKKMFQYLIRNAKEHKKENETLEIDFFFFDYNEKYWLLTVQDNGKELSPELISSIFNLNFTTKTTGTSLGLPIVKNIVSGFNGEITFSTETDHGTQFNIYIPKIV